MNVYFADFTFDSLSGVTSQYLLAHVARCRQPVGGLLEDVTPLPTSIPALHLGVQASDGGHPGRGVPGSRLVSATTVLLVAFGRLKSGVDTGQSSMREYLPD